MNRYYANMSGRFISPDKASASPFVQQGLNRYTYVLNDPINKVDPDGNYFKCPVGAGERQQLVDCEVVTIPGTRGPVWEPPAEWDALSDKCKDGLRAAMPAKNDQQGVARWLAALGRANAAMGTLQQAADATGIDASLLAAIGYTRNGLYQQE